MSATHEYLAAATAFRGIEAARAAYNAVESFNAEVDRDIELGVHPAHPKLDPLEAASIANLGLFDLAAVYETFPTIREKFAAAPDALRPLLDTMASFQRDH